LPRGTSLRGSRSAEAACSLPSVSISRTTSPCRGANALAGVFGLSAPAG
jgi:hypothetical protein